LRKGREVLAESPRLQELGLGEHAIADFHAAAFLPDPRLLPGCVDPRRTEFLTQLFETPEYHALHTTTVLQEAASVIAATAFAEQFAELAKEDEHEADEADRDETGKPPRGTEGAGKEDPGKVGAGKAGGSGSGAEGGDREMATMRAVSRALSRAGDEVEEM